MNILALDLATKTGWAFKEKDKDVISGVQTFDLKRGESPGMRFLRLRKWLNEFKKGSPLYPELIVYEQAHHRGGAATQVGVGLVTEVLSFAAENEIETLPVHTATLKKFATGSGRAGKDDMIQAATDRWGIKVLSDDEADAICLLYYAIDQLGD